MLSFRRCCCSCFLKKEGSELLREDVDFSSDATSSSGQSLEDVYRVDSLHFPPVWLKQLEEQNRSGRSVPLTVSTERSASSLSSNPQAGDDGTNGSPETRFAIMENLFQESVMHGDSGAWDVDLPKFFKACDLYRDILSGLGSAVGMVLRDIDANLGQARTAMEESPSQRSTMRSYLSHEHAGLGNLMWLTRGLEFFLTMLVLLFTGDGENAAPEAYSRTLAQYHGWMLQGVVKQGMRMMPGRDSVAGTDGFCLNDAALTMKQRKELVARDAPKAAGTVLKIIEQMIEVFKSLNRWSTSTA